MSERKMMDGKGKDKWWLLGLVTILPFLIMVVASLSTCEPRDVDGDVSTVTPTPTNSKERGCLPATLLPACTMAGVVLCGRVTCKLRNAKETNDG